MSIFGKDDRDGCELRKSVVNTLKVALAKVIKVVLLRFGKPHRRTPRSRKLSKAARAFEIA